MSDPRNLEETGAERDSIGRFVTGHKGYGGRPRKLDFLSAAADAAAERGETSQVMLTKLIRKAADLAIDDGDMAALKLMVERLCGKETDVIQLDDPDAVLDRDVALRELASILATAAAKRN